MGVNALARSFDAADDDLPPGVKAPVPVKPAGKASAPAALVERVQQEPAQVPAVAQPDPFLRPLTGPEMRQAITSGQRERARRMADSYAALEAQIERLKQEQSEVRRTLFPLLKAVAGEQKRLTLSDGEFDIVIEQSKGSKRPTKAGLIAACGQDGVNYWNQLKPTPGQERLVIKKRGSESPEQFGDE